MKRRQFIQLIAASTASSLATTSTVKATSRAVTASQTEGPFYPLEPIPETNNLLLGPEHLGSELRLSGRVLNSAAQPLPSARVEIWQCDGQGIYPHRRAPGNSKFDRYFKGAGAAITDLGGHYSFTTIVPVPYGGRPPHIHGKVFISDKELLTTQIYLKGSGGHERLKTELQEQPDATYTAIFDFVLKV